MPTIAMLAYEGCFASSLSGVQDLLLFANAHWRQQRNSEESLFSLRTLTSDGQPVATASGLRLIPDGDCSDLADCDFVYLPSFSYEGKAAFKRRIQQYTGVVDLLRQLHNQNKAVATHCTGSFLFAEAGLLAGKNGTTSWWMAEIFKQRYPHIPLDVGRLLIKHDNTLCGGGAGAEQLIGLYLIEQYMGQSIVSLTAKTLMMDVNQLDQTPYITLQKQQGHNDALVTQAQLWLQRHMKDKFSLDGLAKQLKVSSRTLSRRFKLAVDDTPYGHLQNLRIDTAKKLLESTNRPVEQVMLQVGYEDMSSFSRLFHRKTGLAPGVYRRRFNPRKGS